VASALSRALDADLPSEITGKYRAGDIRHCFGDISKAREMLGYEPQIAFDQGISELANWLREQNAEDKAESMVAELQTFGLTA
jgi:dTDP-L-rhamnose 4-epimerase